jgi:uncharacterized RmlC-like cupin family protein
MINESEILLLGISTAMYTNRLELGFMFKKGDFVYVVVDANLSDTYDPIDGVAVIAWFHTIRLATCEEQVAYEVMRS